MLGSMTSGKPSPVVVLVAALALCVGGFVVWTVVTIAGYVMGRPAVAVAAVILSALLLASVVVIRRRQ
ncbi:hypothetical protein SAMN05421874_119133 [Nonomuraea maritima]|uniref:Uncharacterized protein n=1 Tax=Nonomuraea maritima TaxID=683260 RepID=A0A1G9J6X9_9ACTN|nr:hypothetical protein [Nonomuraea maritima]SDL33042.1 hypothetical protein SAMN05421874_119133 [Nonomuraea maritima]